MKTVVTVTVDGLLFGIKTIISEVFQTLKSTKAEGSTAKYLYFCQTQMSTLNITVELVHPLYGNTTHSGRTMCPMRAGNIKKSPRP